MTTEADQRAGARPLIVAVIGDYRETASIAKTLDSYAAVKEFTTAGDLLAYLDANPDDAVPIVLVNADRVPVTQTLAEIYADPRLTDARNVVLTSADEHRDLAPTIDLGHLHALARISPKGSDLAPFVASHLHSWMLDHGMDPIPSEPEALGQVTGDRRAADFLDNLATSEDQLTEQLVNAVDSAMGRRPRIFLPAGVRLTRQGEEIFYVFIVIQGQVALSRPASSEELLLHQTSTGRVVGLLSLAGEDVSFFTATTMTDVEVLILSIDQLKSAMLRDPDVAAILAVSAIQGLSQRLKRAEELQAETNDLNRKLERGHKQLERGHKQLARTLRQLKDARLELVSQAKFAMLGELSTGIAHELNNPVAALIAASGHLLSDMEAILASHPQGVLLGEVAEAANHHPPLSTAEERALQRNLEKSTGNPALAFRLVAAGVTDPQLASGLREADLELIEAASSIGTAARNIATASGRIAELVSSLRSYARPENDLTGDVDVRETIDDTLALLTNRLHDIEVVKDYEAVPSIWAKPSQLGQIWTNLLVNAADVLSGEDGEAQGRIDIRVTAADPDYVQVDIIDNGPGIAAKNLPRIFEPRFTTKQGTVRYGLGLGLGLTRSLVEGHGGTITAESVPGRTVFTVLLPVEGPPKAVPLDSPAKEDS